MPPVSKIQMVERFVAALREAGVTVESRNASDLFDTGARPQIRVDALLRLNDKSWLAIEVTRSGYPRDVREGIWKLQNSGLKRQTPFQDVANAILAEHLTTASREMLRDQGCAYFDAGGSLYLKVPSAGILIDIERPPPKLEARRANSIFTSSREQVLHAILHQGETWCTGVDIASASKTSAFTVSQTATELERFDWIESKSSGPAVLRRLSQPGKLLDAWATQWRARKQAVSRWYRYSAGMEETLHQINQRIGNRDGIILTGAAAANQLTPWLTSIDQVELLVPPGSADAIARELDLKPAEKGFNISLIERAGASTLFTESGGSGAGLMRASPFILYLDLLDGRGRNKELAQHLRTTLIKT